MSESRLFPLPSECMGTNEVLSNYPLLLNSVTNRKLHLSLTVQDTAAGFLIYLGTSTSNKAE